MSFSPLYVLCVSVMNGFENSMVFRVLWLFKKLFLAESDLKMLFRCIEYNLIHHSVL